MEERRGERNIGSENGKKTELGKKSTKGKGQGSKTVKKGRGPENPEEKGERERNFHLSLLGLPSKAGSEIPKDKEMLMEYDFEV